MNEEVEKLRLVLKWDSQFNNLFRNWCYDIWNPEKLGPKKKEAGSKVGFLDQYLIYKLMLWYMESRHVGDQLDKWGWKIEAGAKLRLMTQSRDCGNLRKRPLETKFSEQQPRNVLFFRTF